MNDERKNYNDWVKELDELAAEYAQNKAQMEYLDHFRHSKIALLMKEAERKNPNLTSAVAQEREARAHPEYLELLEGLKEATERATLSLWKLKNIHGRLSLYQTQRADRRAEMKI